MGYPIHRQATRGILAALIVVSACSSRHERAAAAAPIAASELESAFDKDLALTKETLAKILEEAGGAQDADCVDKQLSSKPHLRLLTSDEYQNSLVDILHITADYRAALPTEKTVFGFRNNADISGISDAHASAYLDAAIAIADAIKPNLPELVQCGEADGEPCAQKVIDALGPQVWRRPLEDAEKTALLNLYRVGFASSPREGMSLVLASLLNSPAFLYRSEIGKNGTLTPYELASALSYFFWGTAPDAELQALAATGELGNSPVLISQADRLFKSPRSKFVASEFATAWLDSRSVLGANKDAALFPAFTQEIRDAMAVEAVDTFDYLLKQPTAHFESLFSADYSLGTESLALYYRGQAVTENGIAKIKYPGTPRKGVLGLGAVLARLATATETHPIKRGNFVLRNMFCNLPNPAPASFNIQIPPSDPSLTTRQRFAQHTASAACSGCHLPIDGVGFGMEDFDAAALFRETDAGKKVDSSGELIGIDATRVKFNGVGELSDAIANSPQAKRCFVVQWYRLAHGYAERPADICAIRDLANRFEKGTLSLGELLIQIVTHPSYAQKG